MGRLTKVVSYPGAAGASRPRGVAPVIAIESRLGGGSRESSRFLNEDFGRRLNDAATDGTESVLLALAEAVEQRDNQTGGHCERLAFTSVALGMALGLDRAGLIALNHGGYLHDVGKVGIPDAILFKPGKLTPEEWDIMRSHTLRGEDICRHLPSLRPVLPIIRNHHERWDGGGYPDGLRGDEIPLLARIVQTADIYDALISPRPYKIALQPREALRIMREETERGWRDPEIVDLFFSLHADVISKIDEYATGTDLNLAAMRKALAKLQ